MRYYVHSILVLALLTPGCAGGIGEVSGSSKEGTTGTNPFKGVSFFLNPEYTANVEATAAKHPEEAARILNMTVPAVRKAAGRGNLPCHRVGRRLRFHVAEIMATAMGERVSRSNGDMVPDR